MKTSEIKVGNKYMLGTAKAVIVIKRIKTKGNKQVQAGKRFLLDNGEEVYANKLSKYE